MKLAAWILLGLVVVVGPAWAEDFDRPEYWLAQAKRAAEQLPRNDDTEFSQAMVVLCEIQVLMRAKDVEGAIRLAEQHDGTTRDMLMRGVVHEAALAGDIASVRRGIALVESDSDRKLAYALAAYVLADQGQRDAARELAVEIRNVGGRDHTLLNLAKDSLLRGERDYALTVADLITTPDTRHEFDGIQRATDLSAEPGTMVARAQQEGLDPEKLSYTWREIVEAHAKAGRIGQAAAVAQEIPEDQLRSGAWVEVARAHLAAGDNEQAARAVARAKEAAQAITGMMAGVTRPIHLTEVAELEISLGDVDEALVTIREASGAEKGDPMGVFAGLGGRAVLVSMLVKAGRLDEAAEVAGSADDPTITRARALALAEAGEYEQLAHWYEGVDEPSVRMMASLAVLNHLLSQTPGQRSATTAHAP